MVRLDRELTKPSSTGMAIAPTLEVGQRLGRSYGGNAPGRIGRRSRHCYIVELIEPLPRHAFRDGARWTIGLLLVGSHHTVSRTTRATIKHSEGVGDDWQTSAARRLGC